MSTRELARGLAQVCKAFRHLDPTALCLSSSKSKALKWARARWSSASKLLLQPEKGRECSALMSWASCHCHELGPLQQLGIVAIATSRSLTQYASSVAAMVRLLTLQAGHLRLLRLDLWEIPVLPQMPNLTHLIISTQGGMYHEDPAPMLACLQYLTQLETLDLKRIGRRHDILDSDLELSQLKKLRRLRLVNIHVGRLAVSPGCKIAVEQWAIAAPDLSATMRLMPALAVHSATWHLNQVTGYHWPNFTAWCGLQKLDLQAWELGGNHDAERLYLGNVAHIPVVRLRSNSTMYLTVPEEIKWKHLCLECYSMMDIEFEDVTTFGKDLVELRMVYGLLNGNSVDSDLFLGLHLLEQGLQYLAETCDVKAKRKTLFARRSEVPSMAGNVHDICICGACGACLTEAGIMHNHQAGSLDPSPMLSGSLAAPLAYYNPPPCPRDTENGLEGNECHCMECTLRMKAAQPDHCDAGDNEDDEEWDDEDALEADMY
ncbi:g2644 [Coccomyxa viridis]|uniref:G2644 protein n=1 Tax=Coccomyxa viridis TaxID=1274662 RepID=A0ABP1FR32_9CHLO